MTRNFLASVCLLLAFSLAQASLVQAVEPDEILKDPKLEERARALSANLRCLVCQNQSIDDSNAPLARDLRVLVRDRLKAGDTDEQVMTFLTERYGDFILLKPPFKLSTALLWLAPALVLLLGMLAFYKLFLGNGAHASTSNTSTKTSTANAPAALSAEEQKKLDELLK